MSSHTLFDLALGWPTGSECHKIPLSEFCQLIEENEEDGERVISLVTQKQLKGLMHEYVILEIRRVRDEVTVWIRFDRSARLRPPTASSLASIWRADDTVKYASTERQLGIRGMPTKVLARATFEHGPTLREVSRLVREMMGASPRYSLLKACGKLLLALIDYPTSFDGDVWGSVRRGKATPYMAWAWG
ncbi:hypothetical protein BS47DRAFT_1370165 [Hydnum rufescens UP504]|uniref:Uncharacterized protein n=1 Tax=Hydnum rufescens UP504 TaxID=1448309 RepID=A0A9P6AAT8_9AGAM|nr:hypothetical protein BS47DRAFT_1370165 [Hydnum rufescens UP504]